MNLSSSCRPIVAAALYLGLTGSLALTGLPGTARAQAIVASINGDPITTVDVEQRMKLLRALHRPATREAAIESMFSDRLKAREASRFGINLKDEDVGEEVQTLAKKMKISTQQFSAEVGRAGVTQTHLLGFLKAEYGYSILIRAMNKGVEASETTVRQELAKEKGKGGGVTSYTIRQVVFTLDPGDGQAAVSASAKEAEALRTRFASCVTGIPYAKSLPGVAVREKLVRSSTQLNDSTKDLLDKLPIGHLTPPSRSPNGIEMIALCDRSAERNDEELRKTISERILADHMEAETQSKFKEMRAAAAIEKR